MNKIKFFLRLLCLTFSVSLFADAPSDEKPFVIVIPSYNNKDWYQKNLDSVFTQRYQNYRVIYIADGCTDGTDRLVEEYIKQSGQEERFTYIKNLERHGALACQCRAIFSCEPQEIVVDLDGNDWLANDKVLTTLNKAYADPNVWMTYGQFLYYPEFTKGFAYQVPAEIIEKNKHRSFGGAITHLKTFYAGLFQKIEKEDFLYDGKFIPEAYDLSYTIPIAEMAGSHCKFIPQVLYIYNHSQPLNANKKPSYLERKMDDYIRKKQAYAPLDELPFSGEEIILPADSVYNTIKDIYHPTINDYRLVQNFLSNGERKHLERLRDMEARIRDFCLIGKAPQQLPQSSTIPVNCDPDDRENCILLYASFNLGYPKGLRRLIEQIKQSDFKGHVLVQLGGWPNTEDGCLILAHVPYAFKVSFFKEAERRGFKRALWLDTAVVPVASLNDIFGMIQQKGYFAMGNSHMVGPYINSEAPVYFGLTRDQTFRIPSCSAGLFGVDFTNPLGKGLVDRLYKAAFDADSFFSSRSDQNALSIILYQAGIEDLISLDRLPHHPALVREDSLFRLDREFVGGDE